MNLLLEIIKNLIELIHSTVGDFGVTIVCITLLIKIILIPLSFKQKNSSETQKQMTAEMNVIKEKYKNQKEILEKEMQKVTTKYASNTIGCLLTFIQMPIMISLYRAIISMPIEIPTTILLPWISDLKSPDTYFIIPVVACIVQLLPNVLGYFKIFKGLGLPKVNKAMIIVTILINAIFVSQVPVIIGLYFITSSLYSFIEQMIYYLFRVKQRKMI
ncbi:YidC/Oxa1 family membrane protein insertase [Natranaerovirga hydrolytica]|uniref:YidC/Oxa1 family membrane protein insertase n=1 Tax=Natranaerovirga hydrolytica TaxID=680378 RepID=A0A4R1N5C1_9FIRM|nr:membrane protein insertase YidC [Natranaerovirga hydrolytica]TCK98179.1 YidC/Oxa1 family membrane protein insertase [Natranaerovirga hydrolytica]